MWRRAPPGQPDPDSGQLRWIRVRGPGPRRLLTSSPSCERTRRGPRIRGAAWVPRPQSSKVLRFVAKRARIRPKCNKRRTYFPGNIPNCLILNGLLWAFFCTGTLNHSNRLVVGIRLHPVEDVHEPNAGRPFERIGGRTTSSNPAANTPAPSPGIERIVWRHRDEGPRRLVSRHPSRRRRLAGAVAPLR